MHEEFAAPLIVRTRCHACELCSKSLVLLKTLPAILHTARHCNAVRCGTAQHIAKQYSEPQRQTP